MALAVGHKDIAIADRTTQELPKPAGDLVVAEKTHRYISGSEFSTSTSNPEIEWILENNQDSREWKSFSLQSEGAQEIKDARELDIADVEDPFCGRRLEYALDLLTSDGKLDVGAFTSVRDKLLNADKDRVQQNIFTCLGKLETIGMKSEDVTKFNLALESFYLYAGKKQEGILRGLFVIEPSETPKEIHYQQLFLVCCMENAFEGFPSDFESWWMGFSESPMI